MARIRRIYRTTETRPCLTKYVCLIFSFQKSNLFPSYFFFKKRSCRIEIVHVVSRLIDWLSVGLFDCSINWLIDWLSVGLFDWLIDWLIQTWLTVLLYVCVLGSPVVCHESEKHSDHLYRLSGPPRTFPHPRGNPDRMARLRGALRPGPSEAARYQQHIPARTTPPLIRIIPHQTRRAPEPIPRRNGVRFGDSGLLPQTRHHLPVVLDAHGQSPLVTQSHHEGSGGEARLYRGADAISLRDGLGACPVDGHEEWHAHETGFGRVGHGAVVGGRSRQHRAVDDQRVQWPSIISSIMIFSGYISYPTTKNVHEIRNRLCKDGQTRLGTRSEPPV